MPPIPRSASLHGLECRPFESFLSECSSLLHPHHTLHENAAVVVTNIHADSDSIESGNLRHVVALLVRRHTDIVNKNAHVLLRKTEQARAAVLMPGLVRHFERPLLGLGI